MLDDTRLLVVDDEEVICHSCRRLFSRQGLRVETSSDALEGLSLAICNDYAVIVLDVKMPDLDGIQFLQALRKTKPDVQVILITGHPSMQTTAAAARLGAADFVTKPFAPEEITRVVQRLLLHPRGNGNGGSEASSPAETQWRGVADGLRFWEESWAEPGQNGLVRVGALLPRSQRGTVEVVDLPRPLTTVYQGLPLAAVTVADRAPIIVPAPISGVVVSVNRALEDGSSALWEDPNGEGWIATICPTRFEEESQSCSFRRVTLAAADPASISEPLRHLRRLGCQVQAVVGQNELLKTLRKVEGGLLVVDAASFGRDGPALVGQIAAAAPSVKVVISAPAGLAWEAAYRQHGIFYYAVDVYADDEIVDVLDGAFRPPNRQSARVEPPPAPPEPLTGVWLTNRCGQKVRLLAASGLLQSGEGLGGQVVRRLLERSYRIERTLGDGGSSTVDVADAARTCDRLVVLLAKDMGRLPGSLTRDTKGEFIPLSEATLGKVVALIVQPDRREGRLAGFDARSTAALAEHIVREVTLC